jgi:hypothetical protein
MTGFPTLTTLTSLLPCWWIGGGHVFVDGAIHIVTLAVVVTTIT